ASLVDSLRGNNQAIQLHLYFSGKFGFKATLNVDLGSANSGKFASLFYYNPETKQFEYVSAAKIGSDGKTDLDFTHASDYVVVISNEAMTAPIAQIPDTSEGDNPTTGEKSLSAAAIITAALLTAVLLKRKN
ncbi:MAG: hypothetical protein WC900_00365, partial [Oscillospiraceae bacterium]